MIGPKPKIRVRALSVETLENRDLFAVLTWDNNVTAGSFEAAQNWLNGAAPAAAAPGLNDTAIFDVANQTLVFSGTPTITIGAAEFKQGSVILQDLTGMGSQYFFETLVGPSLQIGTVAGIASVLAQDVTLESENTAVEIGVANGSDALLIISSAADRNIGINANTNGFFVGVNGKGEVQLESNGNYSNFLYALNGIVLGQNAGGAGTFTFKGQRAEGYLDALVTVGRSGAGTLNLFEGSVLEAPSLLVGENVNSTGTVTISGGSNLRLLGGDAIVGSNGIGTMVINTAGQLLSKNGAISVNNGAANSKVTVSGLLSYWYNEQTLNIGAGGKGTLVVDAGGMVRADDVVTNNANGVIQGGRGGIGGADAYIVTPKLSNLGTFIIGFSPDRFNVRGDFEQGATGSLQIELGGTVASDQYDVLNILDTDLSEGKATLGPWAVAWTSRSSMDSTQLLATLLISSPQCRSTGSSPRSICLNSLRA